MLYLYISTYDWFVYLYVLAIWDLLLSPFLNNSITLTLRHSICRCKFMLICCTLTLNFFRRYIITLKVSWKKALILTNQKYYLLMLEELRNPFWFIPALSKEYLQRFCYVWPLIMINHTLKINYHARYHYNIDVYSQTMKLKEGDKMWWKWFYVHVI
jgi:hypothetical protein